MRIEPRDPKTRKRQRVRFAAVFLIGLVSVALIFFIFIYQQFTLQQKSLRIDEKLRLELASKFVSRSLQEVTTDIQLLAESIFTTEYILNPNAGTSSRVKQEFLNLARNTGRYDQIRIIDTSGNERIRIDYNSGSPVVVEKNRLQNKSRRYYFKNAMSLNKGQIYISSMDLNVERGQIEKPLKPVIRFVVPLYKPGETQIKSLLVLNFLAQVMMQDFGHMISDSWGMVMILNEQGSWLYRQDKQDEWDFLKGSRETFTGHYPAAWRSISSSESGVFANRQGFFMFTSLPRFLPNGASESKLNSGPENWRVVSYIAPEHLEFTVWEPVRNHYQSLVLILLLMVMFSYLISHLRTVNIEYFQALANKESQYRNLFENMADGYALHEAIFDENGKPYDLRYLEVNTAFENILGLKKEDVVGKTILELLPDVEPYWVETYCNVAVSGKPARLEQYGGSFGRYFEIAATSPGYGLVAVIFADVTDRRRNEEKLRQAAVVFDSTTEAIMITDAEAKIISVNKAFTEVTGFKLEDVLGKKTTFQKSGKHDDSFYQAIWRSLKKHGQWQGEIWNRRKDGVLYPVWENISVVKDEQGKTTRYISIFSDISTIKKTEQKLNHLAHHDSLTGLANRLAFNANLEQALQRAQRHQNKVALLFMDLDRFKEINDTMGHAAGDRVLQVVAKRLKKSVRAQDVVCRLGGDEFTIILEELSKISDTEKLAKKIIHLVSQPIPLDQKEVAISASVGISIYPDDADNAQDLAKAGDTAMYSAKSRGRQTFAFFSAELDSVDTNVDADIDTSIDTTA